MSHSGSIFSRQDRYSFVLLRKKKSADFAKFFEPSLKSVGRKSSSGQRNVQPAASKHNHRDHVFNIAKTISHSDGQFDLVVGSFNSCIGNTMPDG